MSAERGRAWHPQLMPASDMDPTPSMDSAMAVWAETLADSLGAQVLKELTRFAREATPGAMLTIRRTRDGVTAQFTGAIVGGTPQEVTLEFVEEMIEEGP